MTGALLVRSTQPLPILGRNLRASLSDGALVSELTVTEQNDLLGPATRGHALWFSHTAGDPPAAATSVGVLLAVPQSAVDIVAIDSAGVEVAQQSLEGGPLFREIALRGLVSRDVPLGRVELRVRAGRVGGYVSLTEADSGDVTLWPVQREPRKGSIATIVKVSRGTGLRLFNPAQTPAVVALTPLSSSIAGLRAATVTLAAGELKEYPDAGAFGHADYTLTKVSDTVWSFDANLRRDLRETGPGVPDATSTFAILIDSGNLPRQAFPFRTQISYSSQANSLNVSSVPRVQISCATGTVQNNTTLHSPFTYTPPLFECADTQFVTVNPDIFAFGPYNSRVSVRIEISDQDQQAQLAANPGPTPASAGQTQMSQAPVH